MCRLWMSEVYHRMEKQYYRNTIYLHDFQLDHNLSYISLVICKLSLSFRKLVRYSGNDKNAQGRDKSFILGSF